MEDHKQYNLSQPSELDNSFELKQDNILRTARKIETDSRSYAKSFGGNYVVRGQQTTGYSSLTVFNTDGPGFCQIRTHPDPGNATITLTGPGESGQELYMKIDNDTDANRTITFGSYFSVTGTLTGSTAATAILHFISNGSKFWEVERTTGLT